MGLYLAIFDDDEDELDGVEVGMYADFDTFRKAVSTHVEDGNFGSRCPTLMLHSDCDGQWSSAEAAVLRTELAAITEKFLTLPPEPLSADWKKEVSKTFGLRQNSLYDCFFDVDGEPLLERLAGLAQLSVERNLPILFQ